MTGTIQGILKTRKQTFTFSPIRFFGVAVLACAMLPHNLTGTTAGSSRFGLKGDDHVGIIVDEDHIVSTGGYAGHGSTESMGPVNSAPHGLYGNLAAALQLSPAFAIAVGTTAFIQYHPADEYGSDKSMPGSPFLHLRRGLPVTSRLKLGGEIRISVPGSTALSLVGSGTALDFSLLATLIPAAGHILAGRAGFRLDNGENASPDMRPISVPPGNQQLTTDEEGGFQLDVAPGQYTVAVEAPGYRAQRREVKVSKNSVEILNVEWCKK